MIDAEIRYLDEEGNERSVTLSQIREDIGFEYGLEDNVLQLSQGYKITILSIDVFEKEEKCKKL